MMFVNATNGYDIYCQNTNETLHLINRKYKDGVIGKNVMKFLLMLQDFSSICAKPILILNLIWI